MKTRNFVAVMTLCAISLWASNTTACTGIRLTATDGSIVYARTMEVGSDLQSDMLIVPRGWNYVGETPNKVAGLQWTTKYGLVGPNVRGLAYVCDGLNEKGLAVGNFLFPGTAGYQKIDKGNANRAWLRTRSRFICSARAPRSKTRLRRSATCTSAW